MYRHVMCIQTTSANSAIHPDMLQAGMSFLRRPWQLAGCLALASCAGAPTPAADNNNKPVSASEDKSAPPVPSPAKEMPTAPASETPRKPAAPTPSTPAAGGERADFEALCKALNHDYIDGTLTDYYRNVAPTTALGRTVRTEGNDSVTPGRDLLAALTKFLGPENPPGPQMPHCSELIDQIDELE